MNVGNVSLSMLLPYQIVIEGILAFPWLLMGYLSPECDNFVNKQSHSSETEFHRGKRKCIG